MDLPIEDERPRYLLAADALRQEIVTGRLKPGDKLPTNAELEKRFGIANMTVRNAIAVLRKEGLVYSVQGKGSFVRQAPAEADSPVLGGEMGIEHTAEYLELSERITTLESQLSSVLTLLEKVLPHLPGGQQQQQ